MAWRIVKQPNGLYARFADPVDHFTACNMTLTEALQECMNHGCSTAEAEAKVTAADNDRTRDGGKGRYREALETISVIHGQKETDKIRAEIEGITILRSPN